MSIKNWIWTSEEYDREKPVLCFFRKAFNLDSLIDQPVYVKVSADTRYRLYVNGHYVCNGPRRGDDKQWFYERIDINPYLKNGVNVIGAMALRYPPVPYRGFRSAWRTQTPGLIIRSENELVPSTDDTWKSRIAREVSIDCRNREYVRLFQEETVKGSLLLSNWNSCALDDSDWAGIITYRSDLLSPSVSPMFMKERTIPLLYETRKRFKGINHIVSSQIGKDSYELMLRGKKSLRVGPHSHEIVDILAERLNTAFLELSVAKGKGSVIRMTESEAYSRETVINNFPACIKGDRLDPNAGELRGPVDEFYPGGYGTEEVPEYYEPFHFREFLLIRMEIITGEEELIISDFTYRESAYPLNVASHVETSDPSLEDIWRISENTLNMCMHETYEDCPGYEQLQYVMDTRSQILFTYSISGDDTLARAAIDDFCRSQRPDGLIAACYPSFKSNVIPSFSVYYVLMLHDHMMYFGDRELLKHYYPSVMRICDFYITHLNDKNLFGYMEEMGFLSKPYWGYIDSIDEWPAGVVPVPQGKEITMMSLLTMTLLRAAGEIADYIGWHNQAAEYLTVNEQVRTAIREYCLSDNGLVQDSPGIDMYSTMAQTFATLNDVFTEEEAIDAMKRTLDGTLTVCSLPVVFYQLRALEKTGLYDSIDTILNRWRAMLKKNLTTCQEHDTPNQQRSDCHAWSSIPLYEITSALLGVRPAAPGYEKVAFCPQPSHLSWARGQVMTPRGLIRASYEITDGKLQKQIEVPEGMEIIQ